MSLIIPNNAADFKTNLGLGTAADVDVGTSAGNAIQLGAGGALPAVDGSNLTGVAAGGFSPAAYCYAPDQNWTGLSSGVYYDCFNSAWFGANGTYSDSDSIISGGNIAPSVAGYYLISASGTCYSSPSNSLSAAYIAYSGPASTSPGFHIWANYNTDTYSSQYVNVSLNRVAYFNGTTDTASLSFMIVSSGTIGILKPTASVFCIKPD